MKLLKPWKKYLTGGAAITTVRLIVLIGMLYLSEIDFSRVSQFDKIKILIYSK